MLRFTEHIQNKGRNDMKLDIEKLKGIYELKETEELPEIGGTGYVLSHIKTKARVLVIENDDDNKVFDIGFRTPPTNSKGIQHIVEHTVLCGSEKYPAKDPFVELVKGSLNTFLNAMTYPDKTVYPVASCNSKDFRNLMDVYLDAVFHPNIYKFPEIFMQEGWHYEMEDESADLTINGVVYNEMRGVYSSPDSQLARYINEDCYPDTVYSVDSGGNPDDIPTLTREEYLDYHRNYYHPSNSYIYIYGNEDFADDLIYIDKEYLSGYDYLYVPSEIKTSKSFDAPKYTEHFYSLSDSEELKENTYLSYNVVMPDNNALDTIGMRILNYVLLTTPGAPLRKAIMDLGICSDVDGDIDDEMLQPIFSITARGSDKEHMELFVKTIEDVLKDISEKGISRKSLLAALTRTEFKHKEGPEGRYPKGLIYGLSALSTWLYDDDRALDEFKLNPIFEQLRDLADEGYFENLIKEKILGNMHRAVITLSPAYGLNKESDEELRKSLAGVKESLSTDEIKAIVEETEHLKKYQSEPSPEEDLMKIPLLKLSDIDPDVRPSANELLKVSGANVLRHDLFTNGLSYVKLIFDISDLSPEMLMHASLLSEIFEYVDTDRHTYSDLSDDVDILMGGSGYSVTSLYSYEKCRPITIFEAKYKTFDEKTAEAGKLFNEVLFTSHIDDKERLREIISETRSGMRTSLLSSGHITASGRAAAYISELYAKKEYTGGLEFYKFIDDIYKNFDEKIDSLILSLKEVFGKVFRSGNLLISFTSEADPEKSLGGFIDEMKGHLSDEEPGPYKPFTLGRLNEGLKASSKVQYAASAGAIISSPDEFDPALNVLQMIFSYDYLWINLRVKGGAYGAMCRFQRNGVGMFMSYRDPNLRESYGYYDNAADFVENFDASDRDMTKYIIGTISMVDVPLTPSQYGDYSLANYITGVSVEMLNETKMRILSTTAEDIRGLSGYIRKISESNAICAIGGEDKIEGCRDMFLTVRDLY